MYEKLHFPSLGRRSIAALGLALALSLSACGGDGNGDGDGETTPQRPATTAAPSPTGFDGAWTGRTSQGKPLSFTVANGAVTQISVAYDYRGSSCNIVNTRTRGTLKNPEPVTNGRFAIRAFAEDVFAGRFTSATEASGTGHFDPAPQYRATCRAADFTWRARR